MKRRSERVQGEGRSGCLARGEDGQRDWSGVRCSSSAGGGKKEIQEQAKTLFEGKRGPKPMAGYPEPELLYSEIGKLKVELDWLKKSPG